MATYFHVALSGPARTWLMNQAPGSIYSWEELCARFVANFASAYQRHGVEAHLHAGRNLGKPSGCSFPASPRYVGQSPVSLMLRWPRMMWITSPHSLPWLTKCARAAKGRAWHSVPQAEVTRMGGSDVVTQGRGKKKKRNKNRGHEKPQLAVSVVVAATGGQGERSKRPRP
jgi:hypothetical protein